MIINVQRNNLSSVDTHHKGSKGEWKGLEGSNLDNGGE